MPSYLPPERLAYLHASKQACHAGEVNKPVTDFDKIREYIDSGEVDKCNYDTACFYFNTVIRYANKLAYPTTDVGNRFDPFFSIEEHVEKLKLVKEYVLHNRIAYLKYKITETPKSAKRYEAEIQKCEEELKKLSNV